MIDINLWYGPAVFLTATYMLCSIASTMASVITILNSTIDNDYKWLMGLLTAMMWINAGLGLKIITLHLVK